MAETEPSLTGRCETRPEARAVAPATWIGADGPSPGVNGGMGCIGTRYPPCEANIISRAIIQVSPDSRVANMISSVKGIFFGQTGTLDGAAVDIWRANALPTGRSRRVLTSFRRSR